ncbi:MAG: UDP-N-acetylglucosamine 2-epimerase (non-hydrolyzing) [Lachnospiraceae bacterium]|nr:UDP-N-acetylglucosamine 2-epimerase (non-hydrolyzing) [Lachnospiraceae bacterium]
MKGYENMEKKKALIVFGTRPEALKMCPLVCEMKKSDKLETIVCVTEQHREMLHQVLEIFDVKPDYNLHIMQPGQTLFDVTTRILTGMKEVIEEVKPDVILVHGDTSTAFTAGLAGFYLQVPVAHVEAGLRTEKIYSPFPEEFNRQGIGLVASYHFAPTEKARQNLENEGKIADRIWVTGNTGIDALRYTVRDDFRHEVLDWAGDSRLIVLTAHRRENLGDSMRQMFRAIRRVAESHPDVKIVYPVHLNPAVRAVANEVLAGCDAIRLIEPLAAVEFHNLMAKSYLIMTDSGGIQEEAPSLGKPVLVMRDTTERPEGVAAGTLRLVGTEEETIFKACCELLDDPEAYRKMSVAANPYGDGYSSARIVEILENELAKDPKMRLRP